MNVRLFDWRDIPSLRRCRSDSVFLDSELLLTRGSMMVPGVLFSLLASTMGIFTCVTEAGEQTDPQLIGQFIHSAGSNLSHLTFLAPQKQLESALVCPLIERMMVISGERGAQRLLADADEGSLAFDSLRKCGFAVYTRQRIWQLAGRIGNTSRPRSWRAASDQDIIPIRTLYNNVVPGMVQQIEPFSTQRPRGMVLYQNGDLLAYVELNQGRRGIWAQPFFHPDVEEVSAYLLDMIEKIPARRFRPIYICIRSYQSWLEPWIEELGGEAGQRQAVMVRQLVVQQKVARAFSLPALESGQAEVTAPMVHLEN